MLRFKVLKGLGFVHLGLQEGLLSKDSRALGFTGLGLKVWSLGRGVYRILGSGV